MPSNKEYAIKTINDLNEVIQAHPDRVEVIKEDFCKFIDIMGTTALMGLKSEVETFNWIDDDEGKVDVEIIPVQE